MKTIFQFLFLLAIACAHLDSSQAENGTKQVTVGVIVAQTGPLAVVGTTIKNGLILSQRQNDPQNRLRLVIEDDGFQPKNTVAAFQKLMLTEKPGVFITFGSSTTLAIAPLAEQAKVPVVAITIVEAATKGRHYVFRWAVSSSSLDANSAREMSAAGVKSVAIVTTLQDGMLELRNHFINTPGFKVVVDEEFLPSETDFHAVITRIKSAAPDAIYMALLPPQGSLFAKQLRQLGFAPKLFAGIPTSSPVEIANSEGALKGTIVSTGDDRHATKFYADYAAAFPEKPFSEAAYGYDAIKLLVTAAESPQIRDYLATATNISGIIGTYSADGNNSFTFQAASKVISETSASYKD